MIDGERAEAVDVRRDGREVTVVAPQRLTQLLRDTELHVTVALPAGSDLATRTASADLRGTGRYGTALLRSGSGDVELDELGGDVVVETGSGDASLGTVHGDLGFKSGSGDLEVRHVVGETQASTGSGDLVLEHAEGPVDVKTGSGDLRLTTAGSDVSFTTGSGDARVERVTAPARLSFKGASGDVVVGVQPGTPIWTDLTTLTGGVSSGLPSAGEPSAGQPHLELRVASLSGDVALVEA